MDRQWHIRQQLELLSSPTTIHYHRIDTYYSIVEGVQRVRRILGNDRNDENDRLLRACCRNDFEAVRWLLDQRDFHPIDLKRGINRSVLHEAVLHSNSQLLVRLLCQHGADPRQRDSLGRSPFHYAASCGHLDAIKEMKLFIQVPISSIVDIEGRCPLMFACGEGHLALCQWLIEEIDADCLRCDDQGRSCLVYACRSGHDAIVKWLIDFVPVEPTVSGWYPLHFACSAGHLSVVRLLLSSGLHHGQVITNTGHSALFLAMHAEKNSQEITECLLDSDSSVTLTMQDIEDLNCDKSLLLLLVQRRHSLPYTIDLLKRFDYSQYFLQLILLSEHSFSWDSLSKLSQHQSLICYYHRNPLTLKQWGRCFIRKWTDSSKQIDRLMIHDNLKKFLRFESLN